MKKQRLTSRTAERMVSFWRTINTNEFRIEYWFTAHFKTFNGIEYYDLSVNYNSQINWENKFEMPITSDFLILSLNSYRICRLLWIDLNLAIAFASFHHTKITNKQSTVPNYWFSKNKLWRFPIQNKWWRKQEIETKKSHYFQETNSRITFLNIRSPIKRSNQLKNLLKLLSLSFNTFWYSKICS